jgi:SAM-dependent methyltransferase
MGYRSAGTPNDALTGLRIDWSVGHYEQTAPQLLGAAELLVEQAAPLAGARVVDVGCGTGNAALLAARGARVTGVDPALRLLQVASRRAAAATLEVRFLAGEAAALPLPDNSADVVLSVFGVVFAPDPQAAAAELARVTADDGRILLTAWIPDSPIAHMNHVARQAVLRALGAPAAPPPFAWHDPDALHRLFAPHGFSLTLTEHLLSFTAASPRDYLDRESANHPLAVAGRQVLEQHGTADQTSAHLLAILEAANEDPTGFRVTSRYITAAACRGDRRRCGRAGH